MADLSKVNIDGTDYNFKDSKAIKGVQVNGIDLTIDVNGKVNISNNYIMRRTQINATALDQNSWYPVTVVLPYGLSTLIEIDADYTTVQVNWSSHPTKRLISTHKIIQTIGSGYGINKLFSEVYVSACGGWTYAIDPVQNMGQETSTSTWYVYVRGGGLYNFRLSNNLVPVLHTTDYAITNSNGSTTLATLSILTTTNPNKPIAVTVASKTSLSNYLPLTGGTMTGDITMSNNTITANKIVKSGGTSSQFLKADGSVDSSVYLEQVDVENFNPILNFGEEKRIANIDGTGIFVTMPANPNTDTKVTSVDNHYTPTANENYFLPTNIQNNTYVQRILRDAKGHVTGVDTKELSFSLYGVDVVIPQSNMYNYSNGVLAVEGVLEFLQCIANSCITSLSYTKFCNGFILNVKDGADTTLNTLAFRSSIDGKLFVISTKKPIYFTFHSDNPQGFLDGSSDAFATIYAYVVDGTPLYQPMSRYTEILLWYTSGTKTEGYNILDNWFYAEGTTRNTTVITTSTSKMNDSLADGWKNYTAITLQVSELDTASTTLYVEKYGYTSLKKVKIVAPAEVMSGANTLTISIYNRTLILDKSLSTADITVAYDEKGNVMDVSIS